MADKPADPATYALPSSDYGHSRDYLARSVSITTLVLALATFLFGNNIAGRVYGTVFVSQQNNKTIIEGVIAILNVGLAIFALVDVRFLRPIASLDDNSNASNSFRQLLRGWQLLWLTWVVFYLCLAAQWLHFINPQYQNVFWKVSDILNMVNGFFFYYLFFVLDQPSVASKSEPNRARAFRRNLALTFLLGCVVLIMSAAIPAIMNALGRPFDSGVLLPKLMPAYIAVGMAFFFGRLDSHYLRLNRVILAPFYLYAIIQLFWEKNTFANLSTFNSERVAIFSLALILKFAVFITLSRLMRHDSFRKYFVVAEEGLRTPSE